MKRTRSRRDRMSTEADQVPPLDQSVPLSADSHGLAGQTALVVGGAGLIGSTICRVLLSSGMAVVAIDRDLESLRALQQQEPTLQGELADITDPSGRSRVQSLASALGASHLIHAAGWRKGRKNSRLDHAQWTAVVDVNLVSPAHVAEQFIDSLAGRGQTGSIVFLGSVHSHLVLGDPSYSAAKAGLEAATRELARRAAPSGVRVNLVAPGHVAVGPQGGAIPSQPTVLGGKALEPATVARAVRFLTCDHCSPHTTGAVLNVDGGLSLAAPWLRV